MAADPAMTGTRTERLLCAALRDKLDGRPLRLPVELGPLWSAFLSLSRARSCGPVGPNPLAFADILAWAQLMRVPLQPHHVEALCAMDRVFMAEAAKGLGQVSAPQKAEALPEITPALFDMKFR